MRARLEGAEPVTLLTLCSCCAIEAIPSLTALDLVLNTLPSRPVRHRHKATLRIRNSMAIRVVHSRTLLGAADVRPGSRLRSAYRNVPPQRFTVTVLKVYSAKDGEGIFRAYVVEWKRQEMIVSDPLAMTDFHEGDTISVLSMNYPFPQGKEPYRLLGFSVIPHPRR
jgi:hypothetical protein